MICVLSLSYRLGGSLNPIHKFFYSQDFSKMSLASLAARDSGITEKSSLNLAKQ